MLSSCIMWPAPSQPIFFKPRHTHTHTEAAPALVHASLVIRALNSSKRANSAFGATQHVAGLPPDTRRPSMPFRTESTSTSGISSELLIASQVETGKAATAQIRMGGFRPQLSTPRGHSEVGASLQLSVKRSGITSFLKE